jgi:hypothetical protein
MNKQFTEQYNVLLRVKMFLEENQAVLVSKIPVVANITSELILLFDAINDLTIKAGKKLKGHTKSKQNLADTMVQETYVIGQACSLYYKFMVSDKLLSEKTNFAIYKLKKLPDSKLLLQAQTVYETANPVKTLLDAYGVNAARVDTFQTLIAQFLANYNRPLEEQKKSKDNRKQAAEKMKQVQEILNEQLDPLMSTLAFGDDAMLYEIYKRDRAISKLPTVSSIKTGTLTSNNISKKVNYARNYIKAETKITLHNESARTKGGMLHFFFAENEDTEPDETTIITEVAPATEKTIVAGEAGFSEQTPVLVVYNVSRKKVRWKSRVVLGE